MGNPQGVGNLTVAALVPYALNTAPSQRFRIEQWAPYLPEMGIQLALQPFADEELTFLLQRPGHTLRKTLLTLRAFRRRTMQTLRLPVGQPVFLHRAACLAGPPFLERWLSQRGQRIVYDFDDAIYLLHSSAENKRLAWLKQPTKTATICRLSHHVVVGNSHLAAWAGAHLAAWAGAHAKAVSVIPTTIDTDSYRPVSATRGTPPVVVGWTGSSTSQTYLEAFAPLLKVLTADDDIELRVISPRAPVLPGIPCQWRRWSPESEVAEIGQLDIGIMPLPDEQWVLGKCALKVLQYMAMGVPTVASAIGANRDVIEHGANGLLAATDNDWVESIGALLRSPELRARLGQEGRRTVEERFSMRRGASALAAVVRGVAEESPPR
jgi:glycosyltransferase involved in cell wall biosynthesis